MKRQLPLLYLARHAETVYNAGGRLQGQHRHTPLTHAGIAQAHAMGAALAAHLGPQPTLALWSSSAGRALQTSAIVAEHLGLNFFDVQVDDRLQEIDVGEWEGRLYTDVVAESGPIIEPLTRLMIRRPPGGEWYDEVAARLESWLRQLSEEQRPCLVISHGLACRVLRGLIVGGTPIIGYDAPVAADAPQGTIFAISDATETMVHIGDGDDGRRRLAGV